MDQMFKKVNEISSFQLKLTKYERIGKELQKEVLFIKLNKDPLKTYFKYIEPSNNIEGLFVTGQNDNKVVIHPGNFFGFFIKRINLDPYNKHIRHNQHHTIFESGFSYPISIMQYLFDKYESEIDSLVRYQGILNWNELNCYKISLHNPHFKYIDYVTQKNETVDSIAQKFMISGYMVKESNKKVRNYKKISEGTALKIPNDYAKEVTLYLDATTHLPVFIKIDDDKGTYEKFEFDEVQINPNFNKEEFLISFPEYRF